jgi:hypothetical protein
MFFLFLFAHLIADFVLQPLWLVQRKQYWDGLLIHGGIVLICMLALGIVEQQIYQYWPLMLLITGIHIVTDYAKVQYGNLIPGPPIVPFLADQVVHISVLIITLNLALPSQQVWGLQSSPIIMPIVFGIAYVVAACATPIAAMVWLDPSCKQGEKALSARMRCLFSAAITLTLTLIIGVIALPASLLYGIVTSSKPRSSHPLDQPLGHMLVIMIALMLGWALELWII